MGRRRKEDLEQALRYQFPDWGWDMWISEEFAILVFEVTKWKETLR